MMPEIVSTFSSLDERHRAILSTLVDAGMDGIRLIAKGRTTAETAALVKQAVKLRQDGLFPGEIWVDLPGQRPRVSFGEAAAVEICDGERLTLSDGTVPATMTVIPSWFVAELNPGTELLVMDGLVRLTVLDTDGIAAVCQVHGGGRIMVGRSIARVGGGQTNYFWIGAEERRLVEALPEADSILIVVSWVASAGQYQSVREISGDRVTLPKVESEISDAAFRGICSAAHRVLIGRADLNSQVADLDQTVDRYLTLASEAGVRVDVGSLLMDSLESATVPSPHDVEDVHGLLRRKVNSFLIGGTENVSVLNRKISALAELMGR